MAKKETTKKATKKVASKKIEPKEVIEEVATSIIENTEEAEIIPEIIEELKVETTVVEQDKSIEEPKVEVLNVDPAVIIPSNEIELDKDLTAEIEKKAFRDTFKEINNHKSIIDRSFGYSWNGMEMD